MGHTDTNVALKTQPLRLEGTVSPSQSKYLHGFALVVAGPGIDTLAVVVTLVHPPLLPLGVGPVLAVYALVYATICDGGEKEYYQKGQISAHKVRKCTT